MKITVLDGNVIQTSPDDWKALEPLGEVTVYPKTASHQVVERAKDAEIILLNKVVIDKKTLDQLPRLKYIGVVATGYNVIDLEASKAKGVIVTNVPAYSTESVAQLTFAHILNITNRVDHYARQNREGKWARSEEFYYTDTPLIDLAEKNIGIIGLGNIGARVAQIANCLHMNIYAYTSKNSSELPDYIHKATLEGLLSVCDIITLHCPLSESTRHLIDAEKIALMQPHAIVINTSRGPLVDEQAMAQALSEERIMAYGADVMSQEPPLADNPLFRLPNAYITPHVAWATTETKKRLLNIAFKNVESYLKDNIQNQVNI